MSVAVALGPLIAYSDHEREKWRQWIAADPARMRIPFQTGGRFADVAALLDHLDHRLGVLTGGAHDLPPRQQAMRDTIAWSYDLLDASSQALFRRLSVFAGWTLESAQRVCAASGPAVDVLTGLSTLVDHSLAVLAEDPPGAHRYLMLDVVQEYAAELRDAAGETPVVAERHAAHFTALAEQAEPALRRSGQQGWHRALDADLPNLRRAFRWSHADPAPFPSIQQAPLPRVAGLPAL